SDTLCRRATGRGGDTMDRSRAGIRALILFLAIVGLVLLAVGIVYFTVAAGKLPSFLGRVQHATLHRTKRGLAGVIAGVLCLAGALALALPRRTQQQSESGP